MRSVTVNVTDPRSWENAGMELLSYLSDLENRANRICERLATIGATRASIDFSRAFYQGPNDVSVTVEPTNGGFAIHARGNAVLFIEFGSGATYGYGHPEPSIDGEEYGPGTYPGVGHWNDPNGWWLPKSAWGNGADQDRHTYGNPPAQAMYNAKQEVLQMVQQVADEVFGE